MPQLILHPWFIIFLFTWVSFLILAPGKILPHVSLNNFSSVPLSHQTYAWSWPWQ